MDEERREQLDKLEHTQAEPLQPDTQTQPENAAQEKTQPKNDRDSSRRDLLHLACGGYLLYLAVKLVTGLVAELPQTGWTASTVISLVGAVLFSAVGIVLLVGLARRFIAQLRKDANDQNSGASR